MKRSPGLPLAFVPLFSIPFLTVTAVHSVPPSPTRVTTTGGFRPTLSPDGSQVAFQLPESGIAVMAVGGGEPDTIATQGGFEPDWSRDNGLLLYRGGNPYGLWVWNPEPRDHTFFTDEGFDDGAVWGAGGNEIIAQTSDGPYGDGLVILSYPGGVPTYLECTEPDQTPCSGEDPTGSPDGAWIAFDDGPVEKVSRNGGTSTYVTTVEQGGGKPAWSPDGNWIAFVAFEAITPGETSISHIWVTDARGSQFGLEQMTDGAYCDSYPAWAPGSDAIYFSSDRSGSQEIWKVPFDPNAVPVRKTSWGKLKTRAW